MQAYIQKCKKCNKTLYPKRSQSRKHPGLIYYADKCGFQAFAIGQREPYSPFYSTVQINSTHSHFIKSVIYRLPCFYIFLEPFDILNLGSANKELYNHFLIQYPTTTFWGDNKSSRNFVNLTRENIRTWIAILVPEFHLTKSCCMYTYFGEANIIRVQHRGKILFQEKLIKETGLLFKNQDTWTNLYLALSRRQAKKKKIIKPPPVKKQKI